MIPFVVDDVVTYFVILTEKKKRKNDNLLQNISYLFQNINFYCNFNKINIFRTKSGHFLIMGHLH